MTVTAALILASELTRLAASAYEQSQDEVKIEEIGKPSKEALSELDAYLKSKGQ